MPKKTWPGRRFKAKRNSRRTRTKSLSRAKSLGFDLRSIHPKFYEDALDIGVNPYAIRRQIVLLHPPIKRKSADFFVPPKLSKCRGRDLMEAFLTIRQNGKKQMFVILHFRVSSKLQAGEKKALTAQFRVLLRRCAELKLTVYAVAVDVETAHDDRRRPAFDEALRMMHEGHVRCLMVPELGRMSRYEATFSEDFHRLGKCESFILYGDDYLSPDVKWAHWWDLEARKRAVDGVREAEGVVTKYAAGIKATNEGKVAEGLVASATKRANLAMYKLRPQKIDPTAPKTGRYKPNARRELVVANWSQAAYDRISKGGLDAWKRKDPNFIEKMLREESRRRGYRITLDSFWWELRMGFPDGKNRFSPNSSPDEVVERPELRLEWKRGRFEKVLEAYANLMQLTAKHRNNPPFSTEGLPERLKAQIAELQARRKARIAWRRKCNCGCASEFILSCNCTEPPTPVVSRGPARDVPADQPQDFVICPRCSIRRSGSPGRIRMPRQTQYRAAKKMADQACAWCGKFKPVFVSLVLRINDVLEQKFYSCIECKDAAPTKGQLRQLTAGRAKVRGRFASFLSEEVTEPKPAGKRSTTKSGRLTRTRHPTLPPQGVPRKMWTKRPSIRRKMFKDLRPRAIADRLSAATLPHAAKYCFSTTYLRRIGLGTDDVFSPKMYTAWNHGQATWLRDLAGEGRILRSRRYPGSKVFCYWIE